jgi:2-keto-4-pentenoate hydratase/2-oxohepta-3-ene-1,7-dioic acid hydratase in catechol pathway
MYLARVASDGPDGQELRILATADPAVGWVDVRGAEQRRLQRGGASPDAARRIAAATIPASMTAALAGGAAFTDAALAAVADTSGDVTRLRPGRFACPVDPPSYRDFMTFEEHFSFGYRWRDMEVPAVMYELPVAYLGSAHSFIGPDEDVPWPHYSDQLDYELELGIVIGRGGRDIDPGGASGHILGLTILNDFSARDMQRREMAAGLGPCKGKHFASAAGPWVATLDELNASALAMTARVNGQLRCESTTADMIWTIEELVTWASAAEFLPTGSLLGSGTANGGSGVEYGTLLSAGDLVDLQIDRLGSLRNRVGAKRDGWTPQRRRAVDTETR